MNSVCPHCSGYGYVQVYCTVVMRVYCDCDAGDKRIEEVKGALAEIGLDPESPDYRYTRRSQIKKKVINRLTTG